MGERCQCYTQQATKLPVPLALCVQIVKGGYFNDWQGALRGRGGSAPIAVPAAYPAGSVGAAALQGQGLGLPTDKQGGAS